MSLIRVRRKRKKEWIDHKKVKSPRRLILLLAAIVVVIWFLGYRF
jgi:hypothetical protein